MSEFWLILGMTLVTFAVRYPILALAGKVTFPKVVVRGLRYVPAAVLTAIILPAMLLPDGKNLAITTANPALIGGIVAGLVAYRTKNMLWTILIGMAAFWGARLLIF